MTCLIKHFSFIKESSKTSIPLSAIAGVQEDAFFTTLFTTKPLIKYYYTSNGIDWYSVDTNKMISPHSVKCIKLRSEYNNVWLTEMADRVAHAENRAAHVNI